MKNKVKSVRVWFCYRGNADTARYVIGTYHPNVRSIYISECQYRDILKRYGAKPGDVHPYKGHNVAQVKIIWNKGLTSVWG